jgi:hypothetical protein
MSRIQSIEEHLRELGPLETKRQVPGLMPVVHREVRYVEDRGEEPFNELFERLMWHVNPPLMKDGGALIEGCVLTVPGGRRFQAISYRGDIEGWRQQVNQGAAALKTTLGKLVDGNLVLDDGSLHKIIDCQVEFD